MSAPNLNAWHDAKQLPPPGADCEYRWIMTGEWHRVHIVGHDEFGYAVFRSQFMNESSTPYAGCANPEDFRPLRTPEQIAEERREAAIIEMESAIKTFALGWSTTRMACAALYDAGYRKLTLS